MDFPATGGTVSYWGHGGHRELAFHVPEWRAYAPQCMAPPYDQLFKQLRRYLAAIYPAALKRSADGLRIAPDRPKRNQTVQLLHNFDKAVENASRKDCNTRPPRSTQAPLA